MPEPRSPCTSAFEQLWELLESLVHSCCGSAHSLCWSSPHLQRPSSALSHTSLGGSLSREGPGEVGVGLRWSFQPTAGAHVGPWAAEPIPTAPRPAWQSRRGCPTRPAGCSRHLSSPDPNPPALVWRSLPGLLGVGSAHCRPERACCVSASPPPLLWDGSGCLRQLPSPWRGERWAETQEGLRREGGLCGRKERQS